MKNSKIQLITKALVCGACLVIANTGFAATPVTVNLCARQFNKLLPDGTVVAMWGFVEGLPSTRQTPSVPGPRITIPSGNNGLIINLYNQLPPATSTRPAPPSVSLVIPGQNSIFSSEVPSPVKFTDGQGRQRAKSFVKEVLPGQMGTYTWPTVTPGTYLYHSGSHPAVQVQMGLYGTLVVRTGLSSSEVYPGIRRNNEAIPLLFSEIDVDVHDAVAWRNGAKYGPTNDLTTTMHSTIHSRPQYFLINGVAYSTNNPPAAIFAGYAGQTNLLRLLNAGLDAHVPVLAGHYFEVVAEDGKPYPYPRSCNSLFLPALKTMDVLVKPTVAGTYPIYDRRLGLVNSTNSAGGMLGYLQFSTPR